MVKKKITKIIIALLLIPVILISPLILFYGVFFASLPVVYIAGQIDRHQIRDEIFEYVLENKDEIELENLALRQEFYYKSTGLSIGGVEYGYIYSPSNSFSYGGEKYRNGYRIYGIPDEDTDWYYEERICENWFYYEIHDG